MEDNKVSISQWQPQRPRFIGETKKQSQHVGLLLRGTRIAILQTLRTVQCCTVGARGTSGNCHD